MLRCFAIISRSHRECAQVEIGNKSIHQPYKGQMDDLRMYGTNAKRRRSRDAGHPVSGQDDSCRV